MGQQVGQQKKSGKDSFAAKTNGHRLGPGEILLGTKKQQENKGITAEDIYASAETEGILMSFAFDMHPEIVRIERSSPLL